MRYNYGAILDFNPMSIINASEYFESERKYILNILGEIEEKQKLIQNEFDIFNPNIYFYIGDYLFDKDKYSLTINNTMLVNGNSKAFQLGIKEGAVPSFGELSIVANNFIDESTDYLNNYFLTKNIFTHEVVWLYDISSPDMQYPEDYIFSDNDILPYSYASRIFYTKIDEFYNKLIVLSHDTTNEKSTMTKDVAIREFNLKADTVVECSPDVIVGDKFQMYGSDVYFSNLISMNIGVTIFKNGYIFVDESPINYDFAIKKFTLRDLSNSKKFIISEKQLADRLNTEIISVSNFNEIKDTVFSIDTREIDDSFYISRSGGGNALSFRGLHILLTEKLSKFYAIQLKLFLSGYEGNGALGELIKYLEDKILELKEKYVLNDECDKRAINNIDEGCNIECGRITLDEPKLMVTKQKLKSIVRCSLTCEGVL